MRDSGVTRRTFLHWTGGVGAATLLGVPRRARASLPLLETYDDGTEQIPAGAAGSPTHVLVVGAGFAGLAAANALRSAGVACTVIEGRHRPGGRAWTHEVGGHPVDLGCSWIHEPVGNPMTRFAVQAGVLQVPADIELDLATFRFFDGATGVVPLPQALETYGHFVRFLDEAASISDELGPDASARDGVLAYLERHDLAGDARRRAEFLLRLITEQPDATDWDRLSFDYWAHYEPSYVGVGQGNFPLGGYRRLVEAMAGDTAIHYGHRVESVAYDGTGVRVATRTDDDQSHTFAGSHVVVTVPLGVLQSGAIAFDPPLPAAKQAALARMWFGQFEKVVLTFDSPFWEAEGETHVLHLSARDTMDFPLWLDHHRINGIPALVGYNTAAFARGLGTMTPGEVLALARDVLRDVYGGAVPEPTGVAVTNWLHDPFSRGSYASVLVGGDFDDFDTLADPVGGRLLFAGEATSRTRFGYADGAMSTGIREAKRLLGSASVRLRATPATGSGATP